MLEYTKAVAYWDSLTLRQRLALGSQRVLGDFWAQTFSVRSAVYDRLCCPKPKTAVMPPEPLRSFLMGLTEKQADTLYDWLEAPESYECLFDILVNQRPPQPGGWLAKKMEQQEEEI